MTNTLLIVNHQDCEDLGMQFYMLPNPSNEWLDALMQVHGQTLDLTNDSLPMAMPQCAEGIYLLVSGLLDPFLVAKFTAYTVSEANGVKRVLYVNVLSQYDEDDD